MDTINYSEIISKHPWIVKKNQDCILSPDSDGLLCGLFMTSQLGWKVRGFYDGKVLLIEKGFKMNDCVFLDMEIFRNDVKSVGQHMIAYDTEKLPQNWSNFDNCISANNIRGFDYKHKFKEKYPLGTIHLLLAIIGSIENIKLKKSSVGPLFYTDGTFKNLFNYPENCLSWLYFLDAEKSKSPLYNLFFDNSYSVSELMKELREIFNSIKLIADGNRGGDKIKISNNKGELINFDINSKKINSGTKDQAIKFLKFLSNKTDWDYVPNKWTWENLEPTTFVKGSGLKPGKARYNDLISKNPLSLAIISSLSIEYTLVK